MAGTMRLPKPTEATRRPFRRLSRSDAGVSTIEPRDDLLERTQSERAPCRTGESGTPRRLFSAVQTIVVGAAACPNHRLRCGWRRGRVPRRLGGDHAGEPERLGDQGSPPGGRTAVRRGAEGLAEAARRDRGDARAAN